MEWRQLELLELLELPELLDFHRFVASSSCPVVEAPAHGKKFGSKYLVGHEVHFACSPGYHLVGSGTRVCQENGSWSGVSAVCKGSGTGRCPQVAGLVDVLQVWKFAAYDGLRCSHDSLQGRVDSDAGHEDALYGASGGRMGTAWARPHLYKLCGVVLGVRLNTDQRRLEFLSDSNH
ncbi:hypothetical protein NFI96_004595 [Prochilodus magdalenae]|nr:hypothetical protein NFI96_004595 [Prochilodus magdalenae]